MKTYILIILTSFLFVACSGSDEGLPGSVPVEITVSTGFESATAVETRSSVSTGSIQAGHPLPVSIVRLDQAGEADPSYLPYPPGADQGQEGVLCAGTLSAFDGGLRLFFNTSAYYLERPTNSNTKLMAWYPALGPARTPGKSLWTLDDGGVATVNFIVDGETDILMSDLVVGSRQQPFTDAGRGLTFAHLLTRFRVCIYTYSESTVNSWGSVKAITLKGKLQDCVVTLPGEQEPTHTKATAIAFTGSGNLALVQAADELPIPIITGETTDGFLVGTTQVGYAMVAPDDNSITLGVMCQKAGGKVTITAPSGGFAAGRSYTLALEFTPDGIRAGATLTDWGEDIDEGEIKLNEP